MAEDARPGPFLAVVGPTGVGKTAWGVRLAQRLGAEVISADSRQVYRGLDIGTATPTLAERAGIPHHFVDELDPPTPWSAGAFAAAAEARIAEVLARGSRPLVVGGSTLYIEALLHGLANTPVADPNVRMALAHEARTESGRARLYGELERVDPQGAATLDPTKSQRLIRALEVYRTTGIPWSEYHEARRVPRYRYKVVVLSRPRSDLYARIDARMEAMLDAGLLEENRALLESGHRFDTPPLSTIGYQEPAAYLRGEMGYDEMVRLLKQRSRRYAKRQLTWFRRRPEYEWLDLSDPDSEAHLLALADRLQHEQRLTVR